MKPDQVAPRAVRSVSILIPTHQRCDMLARTLDGMAGIELPVDVRVELVVIANACTDLTVSVALQKCAGLPFPAKVVEEPVAGLNVARNRGVIESSGEVLAMIDDDVLVERDWLIQLVTAYRTLPADLIGGRVKLWWEAVARPEWMSGRYAQLFDSLLSGLDLGEQPLRADCSGTFAIGANFSFRRQVFDAVGEFRPGLDRIGMSLLSGGETEFARRALSNGFVQYYAPLPALRHWVSPYRIRSDYLCGVARGNLASYWRSSSTFDPGTIIRRLLGAAFRVPQRTVQIATAHALGEIETEMYARVARASSLGNVEGISTRLLTALSQISK